MTPRPEDHVRRSIGAFVLGHLTTEEAAAVQAHLDGCVACRTEASSLAPVAQLLPLVDPERIRAPGVVERPPEMLDGVLTRIDRERGEQRRRRRRSLVVRVAAIAATVSVLLGLAVLVVESRSSGPSNVHVVVLAGSAPGISGEAVVHEDPRSTWVELTTSGLSTGESYAVWLEEIGSGERSPMGTFTGVDGDLYISLYSTLPRDRAAKIGVSAPDGVTVLEGTIPTAQ
ncbi:MAG: zf-HC2 domain-containing protein [Actinomycetota bacterium]|nr:zf-HC2 domain-containing protein [Actinomycetota bacterium]